MTAALALRHWKLIGWAITATVLFAMLAVRTDQRNVARDALATEQAAHQQTIANYRAAQDDALAAAVAQRDAIQNQYRQAAERADNAENQLEAARSAADRFADARELRTYCPAGSAPGRTAASGEADAAPSSDGPGADAVVLTRPEWKQLVGNTLRLAQVNKWGWALIEQGLAEPPAAGD